MFRNTSRDLQGVVRGTSRKRRAVSEGREVDESRSGLLSRNAPKTPAAGAVVQLTSSAYLTSLADVQLSFNGSPLKSTARSTILE